VGLESEIFPDPPLNVVLVEPEIPPNTGNIGRLCFATASRLHLVEPLGFDLDEKSLRRAGMDYWNDLDLSVWPSLDKLRSSINDKPNFWFFTTKAKKYISEVKYLPGDYLVFGRETKGLPFSLVEKEIDNCLRIPMVSSARSLNLATSVGIALYGAINSL
tara:strand:- start:76 stop:555 length:480 start_codon:yes stop_codon:yes gene_type:complete